MCNMKGQQKGYQLEYIKNKILIFINIFFFKFVSKTDVRTPPIYGAACFNHIAYKKQYKLI